MTVDIVKDLAILYELAISFGKTLDPVKESEEFFKRLITRTIFDYASVWLKKNDMYNLIYAYPKHYIYETGISVEEVEKIFRKGDIVVLPSYSYIWERDLSISGVFIFFKVDDDMFFKLYTNTTEEISRYIRKFEEVLKKFGNFIKGAISRSELVYALKRLEKEHRYKIRRSYIDLLTGLPNRAYFLKKAMNILKTYRRVAVGIIDLDNFKWINDSFGHAVGDKVLQLFAEKFRKRFADGFVARIAGDEFAFLIWGSEIRKRTEENLNKLLEDFKEPANIDDFRINISFSAGIDLSEGKSPLNEILKRADIALYRAKELGKGRYAFFSKHLKEEINPSIMKKLHSDMFRVFFQPILNIKDLKVYGLEALIRTKIKDISIEELVSFLEKPGSIYMIDRICIEEAIKHFSQENLSIHVNVSDTHLRRTDFITWLENTLESYAFNPENLVIEITERKPIKFESDIEILKILRNYGIHISIDDFGEGYTSISYLQNIPASHVKIDKKLIKDVDRDSKVLKVVQAIINTCKLFDMRVIAEGVERESQLEILRDLGCDYVQGFLFSPPKPYEEIIKFIKS